jgi:hypothetical protein
MTRIVPALEPDNNIRLAGKIVHNLALALIAPLTTNQYNY